MKKTKRFVATILSMGMMLACSLTSFAAEAPAQNYKAAPAIESAAVPYGVLTNYVNKTCDVTGDGVALRRDPGLSGERLGLLYKGNGDYVKTTGEYQVKDGYTWMKVSSSSIGFSGWVALQYLRLR